MGIINDQGVFIGPPTIITSFREDDDFDVELFDEPEVFPNLPNNVGIAFVKNSDSPTDLATISLNGNNTSTILIDNTVGFANLTISGNVSGGSNITAVGNITSNSGGHVLSNKKNLPFDMPHPNKEGWRLRHVCIEGPEIAVYCRGKVSADGIINLPSFWDGLVNPEDMTISLTPIGCWQELFVKEVLSGKQVVVVNNTGGLINADYYIVARRLDDDLIVEYEGKSHEDYPGGNEGYSFNFEHNYVKDLIQKTVQKHLDNTPPCRAMIPE